MHKFRFNFSQLCFSCPRVWGIVKLYGGKVDKQKRQKYNNFYFLKFYSISTSTDT